MITSFDVISRKLIIEERNELSSLISTGTRNLFSSSTNRGRVLSPAISIAFLPEGSSTLHTVTNVDLQDIKLWMIEEDFEGMRVVEFT